MAVSTKGSSLLLYSGCEDLDSHRVRMVLGEKNISTNIIEVDRYNMTANLSDINPYNSVPTLIDRDLVLYGAKVIMEYINDRFPYPPLIPASPVLRAKTRLMIYRIEKDWYVLLKAIQSLSVDDKERKKAISLLKEGILSISPVFNKTDYFLNENFTILDCCLAPLLWRIPSLGIKLTRDKSNPIFAYEERVFSRTSFQESLTDTERELRPDDENY